MRLPAAGLAVLLLAGFYGSHSGAAGMLGPDEPRYAAIGEAMAESGDWITPRLWGTPWFEKPPLTYWLVAAGRRAGLPGETAARAPVALLSAASVVISVWLLVPLIGAPAAAAFGALLATSAGWLAFSHLAVTDLPLGACFTLAMLLTLRGLVSKQDVFLRAAGVLFGLAVLAKGLVPLALALPLVWFARREWRRLIVPVLLGLAVAAPWYGAMAALHGRVFVDEFFFRHHVQRFASDVLQHQQPWWFYLPVTLGGLFPWSPLLVLLRRADFGALPGQFAAAWCGWGLVFFSLSTNKLPGYLLPLMPALCLLLALAWTRAPRPAPLAGSVLLLALVAPLAAVLPQALLDGLGSTRWGTVPWPLVALLAVPAAAGALLARRRAAAALAVAVLTCALAAFWLKVASYPVLDRLVSARRLAATHPACPDNLPRSLRYGFNYYKRCAACAE